jgi:cobalt-zinc-cadmium resistance protein CzcA
VFVGVAILLGAAVSIAGRMGGEFIPRLSEGAAVANVIRLAGVSIDTSTQNNTRIEQLLLEEFPDEIRFVWSRIGTAEVATDPMGTELTDVFMTLHPRGQWTRASSQTDLVSQVEVALRDLPGMNIAYTQPIELRMNELISGIRSDVGVKVYGDDLDELVRISDDIQRVLLQIDGIADVSVDQVTGQPTLQVDVKEEALARYGLTAGDTLDMIEALGGIKVGAIYEGQRMFPLVMRLPDSHREDIDILSRTRVSTASGPQLELGQVAEISEVVSPATINREWSRRLIRVQANVRGRDVVSFVEEAERLVKERVQLPEGYLVEWGGQFQNLERAKLRLAIIVPITLLLIFVLLYLSLRRLRDVLIIYTGIPFAVIGGVFALWLRDIPFSVSAAVGFIALSGIAVLNGQILVGAIRGFQQEGLTTKEAVINAAKQRLRPVLATATTDAAGFIPMALSTGVGAEVQRPLATVVVGGILTATLLTLFVLPALYHTVANENASKPE